MCGGVKSCKFGAWAGILTPLTPYLWGPMHYMAHKECSGKKGPLGSFRRLRSKNNKWAVSNIYQFKFSISHTPLTNHPPHLPTTPTPPNVPPPLHRPPPRKLRHRARHLQISLPRPHRPAGPARQQDHHPPTRRRWQAERAREARIG